MSKGSLDCGACQHTVKPASQVGVLCVQVHAYSGGRGASSNGNQDGTTARSEAQPAAVDGVALHSRKQVAVTVQHSAAQHSTARHGAAQRSAPSSLEVNRTLEMQAMSAI